VQDVLCLAQDRAALDDKQFLGVTFAAIMAGGRAWTKIPELLAINGSKVHLLEDLAGPLEACGLQPGAAHWILKNCLHIPLQTYTLLRHIKENEVPFPEEYLTLSTVVDFGETMEDFIDLYKVNQHWIKEQGIIFQNIEHFKSTQSVDLEFMEELLNVMCTKSIKNIVTKKKEVLIKVPMTEWMSILKDIRAENEIPDVDSVEEYLQELKVTTGEDAIEPVDLRKRSEKIDGILRHIKMPPNNLQQGVAQAAVNLLCKYPRQIYVLSCGSGKSRITATIALLLLATDKKLRKIHIVYLNEVLKRKDLNDFKDLWTLVPNGSRVEYHAGIDFNPG